MAELFGNHYTRADLLRRAGDFGQIAGIRHFTYCGGRAAGVRGADIRLGNGIRFTVALDRCMDIPELEYAGASLCWQASNGMVSPVYYDPRGQEWLRSFFGGALTTCGLRQAGPPCIDEGEELGLHGRISNTPAEEVQSGTIWDGDRCTFWLQGRMRETDVFAERLVLTRRITADLGGRTIWISDHVENPGDRREPLMLLYHCNAGFPLLDEMAELLIAAHHVRPRDSRAAEGGGHEREFGAPQPQFAEQVYFYEPLPGTDGWTRVALVNRRLAVPDGPGLGLALQWRQEELPYLTEWKMLGEGTYVVGIEPGNCLPEGRAAARLNGRLQFLDPGESRVCHLGIHVLVGAGEIDAFVRQLPQEASSS
jgi:hypothetical protein